MILRPYKKIGELEDEIRKLTYDKNELENKLREIENEGDRKKEGLHKPTALCIGCKNLVTQTYGYPYGCKLDCKCEDREEIGE